MQVRITDKIVTAVECDMLIIGLYESGMILAGKAGIVNKALEGLIAENIRDQDMLKHGAVTVLQGYRGLAAKRLLLLGLGKQAEITADKIRDAFGNAVRAAMRYQAETVAACLPEGPEKGLCGQAVIEGILLGNYHFSHYKSKPERKSTLENFVLIELDPADNAHIKAGIMAGYVAAEAVNLARDLVNHPSNHMTPARMAWHATQIAGKYGLEVNVLEKEQLEQLHMHCMLSVAKGSDEPPKFIVMRYNGAPDDNRLLALVGKGITFDSGGISLKPSEGMQEMKDDMAGAAVVLAATQAIAELKLPVNVLTIAACTENMPSGHALKPGDVISSMAGKTVEIISTDAEGRLVLADAIDYARKLGATAIVDLATLTGACVVALGDVSSGVMSNNAEFKNRLLDAAAKAGEVMWELPLHVRYKEQLKSDIADLKNSGGRKAGAITAAMFLAEFAANTPWAHIDIAGTVSSEKDAGYNIKGATGVGVRTLIELAKGWSNR